MTISATDILVPVCFKTPLLYLLTQKVAQKFGYVLGIGDGRTPLAKAGTAEYHLQKFSIIRIQFVLLLEYKRLEYEISNQNEEYNLETYIIYKINIIYEIYVIYETNMIHETNMMHLINMMYLKIFV